MTGGIVEVTLVERGEGERLVAQALEVHVGDARTMLADHRGDIAAGRGQMRGIGAELDRGQSRKSGPLRSALRRSSRDGDDSGPLGRAPWRCATDLLQASGQALVVAGSHAFEAFGAAADHQMLSRERRSRIGDPRDAAKFLIERVGEDEIGAGIDGDEA